ncbi:MAG: MgtC/SapB family protein [Pseudomonadota bacterium]
MAGWWNTVARTVAEEFSGISDLEHLTRAAVRLLVAAVLGGLVGLQRERHGKSAGLRTHMLLAMGTALFVVGILEAGAGDDAVSRVIQGIASGVGLLCAGSILKSESGDDAHVRGLTTAAGMWMTAAIGVVAGLGREATAVFTTLLALGVLSLEGPILRLKEKREPPR